MFSKNSTAKKSNKQVVSILSATARPDSGGVIGGHSTEGHHISCPSVIVNRSFDTLEISYKIDYLRCAHVWQNLESRKNLLLDSSMQSLSFSFFPGDDYGFELQRTGKKFFPYCLRSGDVFLYLSPRSSDSHLPNMGLKIGSITCNSDLENFFKSFRRFLLLLGCEIKQEILSRVDICVDILCDIKKTGVHILDTQICRSEKTSLHYSHKKLTGVSIGRGDVSCRIYDKIQEMKDSQDMVKYLFFFEKWGFQPSDTPSVTRVEFQLRRPFLKEISVSTFSDMKKNVDATWSYLSTSWLRYASRSIDRKNNNQKQASISPFWSVVQSTFLLTKNIIRKKVQNICNIEALSKQIRGCMTTILAASGFGDSDYFQMLGTTKQFISSMMAEYLVHPDFYIRFNARQKRFCPAF